LGGHSTFVAGTGDGYVYVIDVEGRRRHYRRWRAPGAVTSLAININGDRVYLGTWQKSGVCEATIRGRQVWSIDGSPSDIQQVDALALSSSLLVRGVPCRAGSDGEYVVLDCCGKILSRGTISAKERTRVIASPNGAYVCVGHEELIEHKGKSMREKRAVLLDAFGKQICETGSFFFQANPVLVTNNGTTLLCNGKGVLLALSPSGKLTPALRLPGPLDQIVCSRDGSRVLARCGQKLCLIEISNKPQTKT
jgi:hypothetical protein